MGHWYLSRRNYLVYVEYDGEELPAELTRTGKLRFADECKMTHSTRRRRRHHRRLYHQRYIISMDSDCGCQITCTLPHHSGDEKKEERMRSQIAKQVLTIKKYDQRYLHTYTLFEYLHYIKEPSDISFQYNLSSFHCLFAVGMPNIATQSGVSLYMILVPMHTYSTRVQQRDQTHSEAAAALVTAAAAAAASGRVAVVVPTYTVVVVVRRIVEVRVVLLHHQPRFSSSP